MVAGKVYNKFLDNINWLTAGANDLDIIINSVHVWRIQITVNLNRLQELSDLLNAAEKLRGSKYLHERDRNRFTVSRGVQRLILSKYLNISPAFLEFELGENKKPYLITNDGTGLQFNISHSGDWILLGISRLDIGADVEHLNTDFEFNDILPEHFSEAETAYISRQNAMERFYTCWTRKEALLKATGQGLGEHLKDTPALDGQHALPATLTGHKNNWQINSFHLNSAYVCSIATAGNYAELQFLDIDLNN